MVLCVTKKIRPLLLMSSLLLVISGTTVWSSPGQSAVITLVFPPGARATGLGEAFTGLSNDANALYFNPAGLGQEPLANSWKSFLDGKGPFLSVASKHRSDLLSNELVWAGTPKGMLRYTGKFWESSDRYLIEESDDLKSIARRFVNVDDEKVISNVVWKIRQANHLEMKRYKAICDRVHTGINDSLLAKAKQSVESVAQDILNLPTADRTAVKIYGLLTPLTDSTNADKMSDEIAALAKTKDIELKDLVEINVPFTIAIDDSVTALSMDESDRLWVGTPHGLWRCSESKWSRTTVADGLPSNFITASATGPYGDIAVGTDAGLGIYKNGKWNKVSVADGLPTALILSVAFGQPGTVYAGTAQGLIAKTDSTITVYDTANGLLTRKVTALYFDRQNRLWIGGENGVTIFTGASWKRFKFPGSTVNSIVEQKTGSIWMGTNKGVIDYSDQNSDGVPIWKTYHSKNALKGDAVTGLASYGNDIWVATDKALNKYEWAQTEAEFFYEPLLPAFHLKDLWHTFFGFVYPTEDWGTLGFSINFINMGENDLTDELGRDMGSSRSWEGVFGLSYGFALTQTLSTGLNIKYAFSALAPNSTNGTGVGQTFAIDAAILKRDLFVHNLSIGLMFQNMGPSIYYDTPENSDPIPFTIRLGTAYTAIQTPVHELTFVADLNREIVHQNDNGTPDPFYKAIFTDLLDNPDESFNYEVQQINVNLGAEYWYSHFLALRVGFLGDYIGERYELTWGLGINYVNLNFDFSYIVSPVGFLRDELQWINSTKDGSSGARDGQWRFSFLFKL